jgi:hypothetical protein
LKKILVVATSSYPKVVSPIAYDDADIKTGQGT